MIKNSKLQDFVFLFQLPAFFSYELTVVGKYNANGSFITENAN